MYDLIALFMLQLIDVALAFSRKYRYRIFSVKNVQFKLGWFLSNFVLIPSVPVVLIVSFVALTSNVFVYGLIGSLITNGVSRAVSLYRYQGNTALIGVFIGFGLLFLLYGPFLGSMCILIILLFECCLVFGKVHFINYLSHIFEEGEPIFMQICMFTIPLEYVHDGYICWGGTDKTKYKIPIVMDASIKSLFYKYITRRFRNDSFHLLFKHVPKTNTAAQGRLYRALQKNRNKK